MIYEMYATLIQMDIKWADRAANQASVRKAIETGVAQNPDSDLYVLPEMFSTGYAANPAEVAERDNSSLDMMQELSDRHNIAVCGSVAVEVDGEYYNRQYFTRPGMPVVYYDKHHLFSYSGENLHYAAGESRVVVEWKGVRFRLLTCYDLRFPLWCRNHDDYDVAIVVASWPVSRRLSWDILLKARTIENQCYALGVNRIGEDPSCIYNGGTAGIHPYGHVLGQCEDDKSGMTTIFIDMPALKSFREKFPVLMDRD